MMIKFDNSYARLPEGFYTRIAPRAVAAPALLAFNTGLAEELGLSLDYAAMAPVFAGSELPDGAEPIAQVYAGHQFGGFSPQLGDGRAVLLGEVIDPAGHRRDIQLKGSGPTPYSRNGDGRAWLGPVLREYVVSEAMHALGVPTTRALAAALTGEPIYRQEGAVPGAVLTRVASSHIRVGTFQYFAARRDVEALHALYDYTAARHYPDANGPADFLRAVCAAQAELVAHWMSLGFIHGVMNTDNTALSGETIDYGPCAFMDVYHPVTVFSSIDAQGRYAYDNQAHVIVWNMAQLATSLVPLMPDRDAAIEEFTAIIHAMPALVDAAWLRRMGAKIGLKEATEADKPLIEGLLERMQAGRADFTNTFRALTEGAARDQFLDPAAFDQWEPEWRARIEREADPSALMQASNPWVIPRNHRIEEMILAAREGDFAPFERLLSVLSKPFEAQPGVEDLRRPPEPSEVVQQTFCGT
ncbi:YdiU family protein [Roseovarius sp. LXJ103]|uniref:protein adenylyltransferase SelO n=1 Tax=Roseovarius carneus TaxID=2853164 RepID=UPI000D611A0F|nr:YdiU family protein [Roseovarius carneus]MBZ8119099.1 YdiU family protein [Roseovarius carneus]PWE35265.1 YdiU family protein [Pelagicola sp. LXJ1103]